MGRILYHKLMPKQDKEGGINPPSTLARFFLQNRAAGRQSAAPLLSLSSSVACSNKRETRFINNGVRFAFNILKKKFLYELR